MKPPRGRRPTRPPIRGMSRRAPSAAGVANAGVAGACAGRRPAKSPRRPTSSMTPRRARSRSRRALPTRLRRAKSRWPPARAMTPRPSRPEANPRRRSRRSRRRVGARRRQERRRRSRRARSGRALSLAKNRRPRKPANFRLSIRTKAARLSAGGRPRLTRMPSSQPFSSPRASRSFRIRPLRMKTNAHGAAAGGKKADAAGVRRIRAIGFRAMGFRARSRAALRRRTIFVDGV